MGHVLLPTYLSMLTWAAPTFWLLGASTPLNVGVQCLSESLIPIHLAVRPEVGLLGHGVNLCVIGECPTVSLSGYPVLHSHNGSIPLHLHQCLLSVFFLILK